VAISLQRDVFVLGSQYWTLSCYSCAAGPISIHASTDATKPVEPLLKQAWTQLGFHYGIGCLPLPDCLKSRDTKIFLLTGAGKLISTSCTPNARSTQTVSSQETPRSFSRQEQASSSAHLVSQMLVAQRWRQQLPSWTACSLGL